MEISYNCTKCEKELCFNSKSMKYSSDKIGYIEDEIVLCNECYIERGDI